jgi:PleD family two-component response regulator
MAAHQEVKTVTAAADLTEITDRSLLIVEDDKAFLDRLARAMETRGFAVSTCDNVSDGLHHIGQTLPLSRWWIYGSATETVSMLFQR